MKTKREQKPEMKLKQEMLIGTGYSMVCPFCGVRNNVMGRRCLHLESQKKAKQFVYWFFEKWFQVVDVDVKVLRKQGAEADARISRKKLNSMESRRAKHIEKDRDAVERFLKRHELDGSWQRGRSVK